MGKGHNFGPYVGVHYIAKGCSYFSCRLYVPAYEAVEFQETLIQSEPIPLPSGMPKMPQYTLICQTGNYSCPGDPGEIWGSRASVHRAGPVLVARQTPV